MQTIYRILVAFFVIGLLTTCNQPQEKAVESSTSDAETAVVQQSVYPQGDIFPFMGYSGIPAREKGFGYSVAGPSYGNQKPALEKAARAGLLYPYHIGMKMNFHAKKPNKPKSVCEKEIREEITRQVKAVAGNPNICWWYIGPEELRPWRKNEMDYLRITTEAIRAADPQNRPIWMYEPNHRTAESLAITGKYQDIIGKGFYCNLAGFQNSRIWIKWSMLQQTHAIELLEKKDGRNRIPLVMPELCQDPPNAADDHLIPTWARHDVYLGLMCGGKGVAIWSIFPRPAVKRTWQLWYDSYAHLANELTGSMNLGLVFIHGEKTNKFPIRILSGPREIPMIKGSKNDLETNTTSDKEKLAKAIKLPALTVAEYQYQDSTYVFLCNSSSKETIKFQSKAYPKSSQVTELFSYRHYDNKNHVLYGWLGPLQVKCYKISR